MNLQNEKNMRIMIPESLVDYVRLMNNEIILKKELPEELKNDFEKFQKDYEVSREMFKFIDEHEPAPLTEEEKEFEKYCKLYEEKFGKHAYIAEPSGTREQTINAIKTCLEKNEDLLDNLLYSSATKDSTNDIKYKWDRE